MSQSSSPSCQLPYGLTLVSQAWKASRATLYRQRRASQRKAAPPSRRGPKGAGSDAELLEMIRETLPASPFTGAPPGSGRVRRTLQRLMAAPADRTPDQIRADQQHAKIAPGSATTRRISRGNPSSTNRSNSAAISTACSLS